MFLTFENVLHRQVEAVAKASDKQWADLTRKWTLRAFIVGKNCSDVLSELSVHLQIFLYVFLLFYTIERVFPLINKISRGLLPCPTFVLDGNVAKRATRWSDCTLHPLKTSSKVPGRSFVIFVQPDT